MDLAMAVGWIAIGAIGSSLSACGTANDPAGSGDSGASEGARGGSSGQPNRGSPSIGTGASASTPNAGASGGTGLAAGGTQGQSGAAGAVGAQASGGRPASGGAAGSAGATGASGASATGGASSTTIPTHCASGIPSGATPVDVSHPATVVGTGSADGCNYAALSTAVAKGGVITFDCGAAPVTIAMTATLDLPTTKDTVIDGGGTVTLDGQGRVQILRFNGTDWMKNETRVTLQHLTLTNAKTDPQKAIPAAPSPCSQGFDDGEGGAVYMRDGNLTVIDCTFTHNQAAQLGPDTGGGAIYITGSKHGALIASSVFTDNSAANAGAVGGLFAELDIYDSLFQKNVATGNGANNDDASKCSVMNNGQHEVGSGGNGGAIYQDGASATNVLLCGDYIAGNQAGMGAFGGGVFMTSNDFSGTITVRDSTVTGNTGGSWTQVKQGNANLGTAFGVNAKSAVVENSMLQGH